MYLPPPAAANANTNATTTATAIASSLLSLASARVVAGAPQPPTGGWSSLIGIVTAICGNILISFALNAQRYAHIRLSRDREEWEEEEKRKASRKRRKRRRGHGGGYGTTGMGNGAAQVEVAEERARVNAKGEGGGDGRQYRLEEHEATEEDALIPRVELEQERDRKGSVDSQDTIRPGTNNNNNNNRHDADDEDDDDDEDPDHHHQDKSYLRSPIWWSGIALMTLGEAGNFLAYGFAPASIVSPLGVVALVSNCMIAPLLLGEQFRWRDGLGVLIAIGGCVTVVLSASDSNPRLDPDEIWRLITQWEFETYLGVTVGIIVVLSFLSEKYGSRTILIDLGLVGLYGGYTALSTKGIASLLSNTIWRVVTFPITYVLLAVLIFTAVMQIRYVNRALQHFNATMVIPVQFVLFTISVIVGSAVLYRDFEREEAGDAVKFVGGCALTFLGVWCITSGRQDEGDGDEEMGEEDEEDDAIDLLDEERTQPEVREREDGAAKRRSIIAAGSSSRETPRLQRYRTAESIPEVIVTPDLRPSTGMEASPLKLDHTPSPQDIQDATPAITSSVHTTTLTQISASSTSNQPPPLHATTSAPVVPRSDLLSSSRPRTPLLRNKSGPAIESPSRTSTPHQHQHHPPSPSARRPSQAQLDTPAAASGPRLLSRNSVIGLLPGPLMSPLSTSLSAIVADSLRRGVDSPASTMRRRLSRRRTGTGTMTRGISGSGAGAGTTPAALPQRHSVASGEMDFSEEDGESAAEVVGSGAQAAGSPLAAAGRNRSLSATWGEIFGTPSGGGKRGGVKGGGEGKRSGSESEAGK
ncbi:hypothetical protein LTR86_002908 [Recurvomyces mirabilis]|nr:hypothetical protein LTR86_002908 [Recurvomyces mirabilis]